MNRLDPSLTASHRLQNRLQTALILAGMALLAGLCGELLLGDGAFLWIAPVTLAALLLTPQLPVWAVMGLYHARPLEPWEAPELARVVEILAERAGLERPPPLWYVPSTAVNAFTVGPRREAAIALTDGLLRRLDLRRLAGVLAHELSHIVHHDIRVMGLADTVSRLTGLMSAVGLFLALFSLPLWLLGVVEISWLGVLLLLAAPTLAALLQAALSRTREFAADLAAVELTGDPEGLAAALAEIEYPRRGWFGRILQPRGDDGAPSSLRSHPPTAERIRRLLALAPPRRPAPRFEEVRPRLPGLIVITRRPRRHWSGLWY